MESRDRAALGAALATLLLAGCAATDDARRRAPTAAAALRPESGPRPSAPPGGPRGASAQERVRAATQITWGMSPSMVRGLLGSPDAVLGGLDGKPNLFGEEGWSEEPEREPFFWLYHLSRSPPAILGGGVMSPVPPQDVTPRIEVCFSPAGEVVYCRQLPRATPRRAIAPERSLDLGRRVHAIVASPLLDWVLSFSIADGLLLWQAGRTRRLTPGDEEAVTCAGLAAGGAWLSFDDGTVSVLTLSDTPGSARMVGVPGAGNLAVVSPDGRLVWSIANGEDDVPSRMEAALFESALGDDGAWRPTGRRASLAGAAVGLALAKGPKHLLVLLERDGPALVLVDLGTLACREVELERRAGFRAPDLDEAPQALGVSDDGRLVLVGGRFRTRSLLRVDGARAKELPRLDGTLDSAAMALSPCGQWAVVAKWGELALWQIEAGPATRLREVAQLVGLKGEVFSVSFHDGPRQVVAASLEGEVARWHVGELTATGAAPR